MKSNWLVCIAILLLLPLAAVSSNQSYAREKKLTAEEVVAAHLRSIGSPEALKGTISRVVRGSASVDFLQGYYGTSNDGQFIMASEPDKIGMHMAFGVVNYPGEYFVYDGQDASVAHINPGERSPLGDFIFRHEGIMKEGLLGGVLSVDWPLLNMTERQAKLVYSREKLDGRPVHVIEYRPKKSFDTRIKLFFDEEDYHHLRTEYLVHHRYDFTSLTRTLPEYQMSVIDNPGGPSTIIMTPNGYQMYAGNIMSSPPDSFYTLVEKFGNFKKVGGLTLPHTYTIEYSTEGDGFSFVANWIIDSSLKVENNVRVEEDFYKAEN
jgi:hypothetical protein